jgi:hypothetical protein
MRFVDEAGVRLGVVSAVLPPVVLGLRGLPPRASLGVVVLLAGAGGYAVGVIWSLLVGASAWAWWTGFALHDLGVLTLQGADLARLGLLVVLAGSAGLVGRRGRHWTRAR